MVVIIVLLCFTQSTRWTFTWLPSMASMTSLNVRSVESFWCPSGASWNTKGNDQLTPALFVGRNSCRSGNSGTMWKVTWITDLTSAMNVEKISFTVLHWWSILKLFIKEKGHFNAKPAQKHSLEKVPWGLTSCSIQGWSLSYAHFVAKSFVKRYS